MVYEGADVVSSDGREVTFCTEKVGQTLETVSIMVWVVGARRVRRTIKEPSITWDRCMWVSPDEVA